MSEAGLKSVHISHVPVDREGHTLAYYDSAHGRADIGDWQTLICLHGYKYPSLIFERLVPHANSHHIRLLLVDRRGYGESDPLKLEQIDVNDKDSAQKAALAFMQARGLELANFILQVASPVTQQNTVHLLGWSNGNRSIVSMLGSCHTLPEQVSRRLASTVGSIILWECPYGIFGLPDPPQMYQPLHDKSLTPDEALAAFDDYASGYFKHGTNFRPENLEYKHFRTDKAPTLRTMPSAERARVTQAQPPDYELVISRLAKASGTMRSLTSTAFGLRNTEKPLRHSEITVLWAPETMWEVPIAANGLEELLAQENGRSVQFKLLSRGNHFLHWEEPEFFMQAVKDVLPGASASIA